MDQFPSLSARQLLRVLRRELGYVQVRQRGSHRRLEADGRPALTFSFHDADTIPSGLVRKILVDQVGLDADDARKLV